MPINTGGFGLDRYTAVPTTPFTQADPNAVNTGIMAQFNLASDEEKAKAFKMKYEEAQALHDDRLAQAHATLQNQTGQALADIQLRPTEVANKQFANDTTGILSPFNRQIGIGAAANTLAQQPVIQQAQNIRNATDVGTAQGAQDRQTNELDTALTKSGIENRLANNQLGNIETILGTQEAKLQNDYDAAQVAFENSQRTANDASALAQATTAYHVGQTALDNAKAQYYASGGRQKAAANPELMRLREMNAQSTELKKVRDEPVGVLPDGSGNVMKLGYYEAISRNGDGTVKEGYRPGEPNYNEKAEELISSDVKYHRDAIKALQAPPPPPPVTVGLPGSPTAQTLPAITLPGQAAGTDQFDQGGATEVNEDNLTPEQKEAYEWAMDNQDDPRAAQILNRLPGQ